MINVALLLPALIAHPARQVPASLTYPVILFKTHLLQDFGCALSLYLFKHHRLETRGGHEVLDGIPPAAVDKRQGNDACPKIFGTRIHLH